MNVRLSQKPEAGLLRQAGQESSTWEKTASDWKRAGSGGSGCGGWTWGASGAGAPEGTGAGLVAS